MAVQSVARLVELKRPLPRDAFSNSWVVTRRDNGAVVCETWNEQLLDALNHDKVVIETAYQYLTRLNRSIGRSAHPA